MAPNWLPQSDQTKKACQSIGQKVGDGLEAAGKGVTYSGLTIAAIGAAAGPEGAVPGIFIAEAGAVVSSAGQVSQDIAHGRSRLEIGARALANVFDGRLLGSVVPSSVRSKIGDALAQQALGDAASGMFKWLDLDRCSK